MNTRWLGTLSIIGGLAYVVLAVYRALVSMPDNVSDFPGQLLGILWAAGAICGWLGFIAIRGTGQNIAVRFLSFLPIVGLSLVLVFSVYALATRTDPFSIPLMVVGLMLELIGSVLNTVFALAARTLPGWRKFAPLGVVLGVVVGGLFSSVSSAPVLAIPFCLGIAYATLGYVVQSAAPAFKMVPQPA